MQDRIRMSGKPVFLSGIIAGILMLAAIFTRILGLGGTLTPEEIETSDETPISDGTQTASS